MSKSLAGQSQLLLPVLVIVFASAVAVATNQTLNMTGMQVLAGNSSNVSVENASIANFTDNGTLVPDTQPNASDMAITTSDNVSTTGNTSVNQSSQTAGKPVLTVMVSTPERLTRGGTVNLSALVTNTGPVDAKSVTVYWKLPDGFTSDKSSASCGDIAPGGTCTSEITVQTSLSVGLGKSQIGVEAKYAQ